MNTRQLAQSIRRDALRMVHQARASHIGACLSIADILAVLYGEVMDVDPQRPRADNRDRFVLSKGHAAAALHATLAACGFFPKEWLDSYGNDGSPLAGHVTQHGVPGVELSTGSLGHGLSVANGMALAARRNHNPPRYRCFVLLGDGECQEGSVWEAAQFAAHHRLDNLIAIVDHNRWQGLASVDEVMSITNLPARWSTFGWQTHELDGHDHRALTSCLHAAASVIGQPTAIIAHTVKGKGVSFMEDQLAWHYKSPDDEQLAQALHEVSCQQEVASS